MEQENNVNVEVSSAAVSQDSKNMALISWIGFLFFGFVPPLIMFLVKKDDAFSYEHAKEALNVAITLFIAYFICGILAFVIIGLLLIPIVGIYHLVVGIMGAVAASKGNIYKAPFAFRFIK
ncbi:DUF4870 domain-containing protein [Neisseria sp. Ec49-e6-T10]|uniref:DUF4870 domain-containing protein n=1 Tax=Neisseria sp. Ec49-e6-T10 TaxID=3140744 RepID=UPI003EBBE5A9